MKTNTFRIKKSLMKICLSAALLLTAVTISNLGLPSMIAYAAEDGTVTISETVTGTISEGGTKLTISGTGVVPKLNEIISGTYSIETVVIEEGITALGDSAFEEWDKVKNIYLPQSLTELSYKAFAYCESLTEITIPKNVTTVGGSLFKGAGLKTINFEEGMITIPGGICNGDKNVTTVNIPNTVTTIGEYAFRECESLTEITIPKSVTSVGGSVFYKSKLQTINFEEGATVIPADICNKAVNLKTVNIPSTVTTIENGAFVECTSLEYIFIPKSVTTIGYYSLDKKNAFSSSGLKTMEFEEGTERIPDYACAKSTTLATVIIPESVTEIGEGAFYSNTAITEIVIPSEVETIGKSAFEGCTGLTKVEIPNKVTTIQQSTFYGCTSLTEITLPNSIESLEWKSFSLDSETPTTVKTNNNYVKEFNWASEFNRIVTFEASDTEDTPAGGGNGEQIEGSIQGITMTGTVSPITTVDITIPLDAISFAIDSDRNLTAQTTQIVNNSQCPLDMYILSIEAIGEAPNVIAKDTYTEKEWNNLSVFNTLNTIAISINENELYKVFNNTERNKDLAILIGRLKSGFAEAQTLDITPDAQYGKSFLNKEDSVIQYKVVFEVVIP